MKHFANNDRCKLSLATFVSILLATLPTPSHSQSSRNRFDPAHREPLMRASVAVELIPSANAEDLNESAESLSQQEEDLKKMEAELLKALDGSSKEVSGKDVGTTQKIADITPPTPTSAPVVEEPKAFPIANAPTAKPLQEIKKQLVSAAKVSPSSPVKSSRPSTRPQKIETSYEEASDLSQKLAIAESQVKILSRELDLSQRSLSSAEERIDELSSLVKGSQPSRLAGTTPTTSTDRGSLSAQALPGDDSDDYAVAGPSRKGITQKTTIAASAPNIIDYQQYDHSLRDSSVATIITDKAPLRVGPGRQESAMYTLPRSSEVTIEYRSGEWYRIITSGGLRGWVYGSSLRFDTGVSPVSTVRVGGVRATYEPVSFK